MSEPFLPESPPLPARGRRRWRLLLFVLVPLVLLVAAYGYLLVIGDRRVRDALAETDRLDPGWRLEDIEAARDVIPDGENSVLTVLAAKGKMPGRFPEWDMPPPSTAAVPEELPPPAAEDLPPAEGLPPPAVAELPPGERDDGPFPPDTLNDDVANNRAFSDSLSSQELRPPVQLSLAQTERIRAELIRAADALQAARSLADQPRGRHAVTYSKDWISTLLPTVQDTRMVAYPLQFDVMVRAQDGDLEGALRSCRAILNNGRSLGDSPFLVSQLVRMAIRAIFCGSLERVLAQGEPPAAALAALQPLVEDEAEAPLVLIGVRGERAGMDRFLEALQKGEVKPAGVVKTMGWAQNGSPGPLNESLLLYLPGVVSTNRAALLRRMNEVVEAVKLPPPEQGERLKQIEAAAKHDPYLVRLLLPAVSKVAFSGRRTQAWLRCAAVALAAERYRQKYGHWPERLTDLAPEFLGAVPADPFDGRPLRYRRDKEGVVVYSVGPDGKDDGGAFDTLNTHKDGTDLGFRLWDVARRRQAPRE
jgi:hypothetical protein